jgi:hypothetical protein
VKDEREKIVVYSLMLFFFPDACFMMLDGVWQRRSMNQCAIAMANVKV